MPTRVNNSSSNDAASSPGECAPGTIPDAPWTSILDLLPEGISIHSMVGEILWANRELCQIYRKPLSELKGLSCRQVFHDDHPTCPHEQVLGGGDPAQLDESVCVSGRDFSVRIEPLIDARGAAWGFMRVMRDVTGERQTQELLRNGERLATLGQLLLGVAHDVGTPLNVISGYAEFLLMHTKPEGQGHKELSAILDQTRRITAVFGRALDLARPSQGKTDAIEIRGLLADSLDLVGHHLRRADVKASLTCGITPPLIYGEAPQLRQALFNLLLNAGQRVGKGGSLELVIGEAPDMPGFLGLGLRGTEADGVAHDFSRSFAFLFAPKSEGEPAAIGLYLARKILEETGARITSGGGARGVGLVIYLPVSPESRA